MRNHILVGLDNVLQKGSGCHHEVELISEMGKLLHESFLFSQVSPSSVPSFSWSLTQLFSLEMRLEVPHRLVHIYDQCNLEKKSHCGDNLFLSGE